MKIQDTRRLSPAAQEALRRRVMAAVQAGMKPVEAARAFGVSRQSIHSWRRRFRERGARGLASGRRGRPRQPRLAPYQAAITVRVITDRCPDQLKLPFALWTREAVGGFLWRRFGIAVSVWTVGRYLRRWGFTPQKPVRRAFEQNPEAVRRWLAEEYPRIRRQARREGAEIHWGDELGLRSDHQAGRSWGRRGRTPVVPGTGKRFGCQMISTVTNRGRMAFMVFRERFTTPVFLRFLSRLRRHVPRRVFLIVDNLAVHKARSVARWVAGQRGALRLFFLPAYSPELNPDEQLNQDVKSNALGRQRPRDRQEMVAGVRSYLHSTQRRPDIVRAYFEHEPVRYAAS